MWRPSLLRIVAGALTLASFEAVAAQEVPQVVLHRPQAAGHPGEEVAIGFRADVSAEVRTFYIRFDLPKIAEFLRIEVKGTDSAHAPARGLIYDADHHFMGYSGYLLGVRFKTGNAYTPLSPGKDLLIVNAIFRVHADAPVGVYSIHIQSAEFSSPVSQTLNSVVEGNGEFQVEPPVGPRPVGGLACAQKGTAVSVSWTNTESYDAVQVLRDGAILAALPGSASVYADETAPGPATYQVVAIAGGQNSLAASCELLVQPPRPDPVGSLSCTPSDQGVFLSWTNGAAYDSLALFRNGRLLATLQGTVSSYSDLFASNLFTVYTLVGSTGAEPAPPVSCRLNEGSDVYMMWAEEVHAQPGEQGVAVRILGTHPREVQAIQMSLRVDPALARIRELTVVGTDSEAVYDEFFYQTELLEIGETGAGLFFPYKRQLQPGVGQHLLTVVLDLLTGSPTGTTFPVEMGGFGRPPLRNIFTAEGHSKEARSSPGSVLVGDSPIPPVQGAQAAVDESSPSGGGAQGPGRARGIRLAWTNGADYSALRIDRDGAPIAEISGASDSYLDENAGPGLHRYRIVARQGEESSFPALVTNLPRGVPGTFLRGDADGDGRLNLTDASIVLRYLFQGGPPPACLDAADADDSGKLDLTDPVSILGYLFRGAGPLPAPGPAQSWFDPTPDDLGCG